MTDTELMVVGAFIAPLYIKLVVELVRRKNGNGHGQLSEEVSLLRKRSHHYGNCLQVLSAKTGVSLPHAEP